MSNFQISLQHQQIANKFGHRNFIDDLFEDETPKIHYPYTLEVPIGVDTQNQQTVTLDLGSQNNFVIVLGKTRVGKTVVAKSIASRMQLYSKFSTAYVADIKNESYNFFTQITKRLSPKRFLPNENPQGEQSNFDYYSFIENEEEKKYQPNYIRNTLNQPETLELDKYKSLHELSELTFIKNIRKRTPVFCYSHLGMDRLRISKSIAWLLERYYMYSKLYNDYGANVKQRILLFGEEMSLYATAQDKEVKASRTLLEEISARGAAMGLGGLFLSQVYNGISPKIRSNARYKVIVVGFANTVDRDEILKEMEISSKEEKQFLSSLEFNPDRGIRECLLLDSFTKTYRKFIPYSPVLWSNPIM